MKTRMHDLSGDIAITSIAGRFPNAASGEALWEAIICKKTLITRYAHAELHHHSNTVGEYGGAHYVPYGAYLRDPTKFDYSYFQLTPREALQMDPQQRLALEVCHEALELSGYSDGSAAGICSVFVGTRQSSWRAPMAISADSPVDTMLRLGGNSVDALATRVAYKLNCRGAAVNVATFCSGSLVAVHLACNSLLIGESDSALAGGACIRFPTQVGYQYHQGGILSPTGRVHAFDKRADGTVFADAIAFVVLRRLNDALRGGEPILAVISGSAMNNDGSDKAGYSAPSVTGQALVINRALAVAGIRSHHLGLVEAHGTGTPVGDGIELRALQRVFEGVSAKSCALGSVKSNLGHADCASGITGLIKAIYAVNSGIIPPTLNCESPCTELNDLDTPFFIPSEPLAWNNSNSRRIAGVSSFGIGGTNVHVIVSEPPKRGANTPSQEMVHLFPISAPTKAILARKIADLIQYVEQHPKVNIADIAFTLQRARRHWPIRRMIIAQEISDLVADLHNKVEVIDPKGSELRQFHNIAPAAAWQAGEDINWSIFYQHEQRRRLPLPPYPFESVAL